MNNKRWYDEAIFYHIYPLGLTGAPKQNPYGEVEHRLNEILPWISHIKEIGCNAIYIGPLFESVGHGYETTDYKKVDSRLGSNEDLTNFVAECHRQGIRVILDGVFNHTGRDFFAFQDIKKNRENSPYKDWYCNVNFGGNTEYNDGFSYENWGGYNLLVKLNQKNPAVQEYICDVIRFWVKEFDIDGIRLDAADVLDFDFMHVLRQTANTVKENFWLMGEVIHGDYSRWVNGTTLHSVTNYVLHKALYSGHNDHNYFEVAHTVNYLYEKAGNHLEGLKLYNFVDNHDVERIYTKLENKAHFAPVHVLMYALPGVPSIYYGSEFGIEGKKERFSDDSLRPALSLEDYKDAKEKNSCTKLLAKLGRIRQETEALSYGDYNQLLLTNRQFAFSRSYNGQTVLVTVNNDDNSSNMHLPAGNALKYIGMLSGQKVAVNNGFVDVKIAGNSGEIWVPAGSVENCEETVNAAVAAGTEAVCEKAAVAAGTEAVCKKAAVTSGTEEVREKAAVAAGTEAVCEKAAVTSDTEAVCEKTVVADVASAEAVSTQPEESKKASKEVPSDSQDNGRTLDTVKVPAAQSYEEMTVEQLQKVIYEKMKKNGPVTDRMYQDIVENKHQGSLINWAKSF